jgi:hypothetical protein
MPYKTCPECKNDQLGVRTQQCECGHKFEIKHKKIRKFVPSDVDWRTLEHGDVIRVIGGSGPYFDGESGIRQYLGVPSGKYEVMSVEKDGFFVNDGVGRLFTYMGETKPGVVGTKEAHKIKLIRKAPPDDKTNNNSRASS